MTLILHFSDGSVATIHYLSNGNKHFPKERVEVFAAGRVLQLDNFRRLRGWGWPGFSKMNLWRQEKGVNAFVSAFLASSTGATLPPIALSEIIETARASILLAIEARA